MTKINKHGSSDHKFFGNLGAKREHFEKLLKPCSVEKDGVYKEFPSREKARGYICLELDEKVSVAAMSNAMKAGRPYKGYTIKNVDRMSDGKG